MTINLTLLRPLGWKPFHTQTLTLDQLESARAARVTAVHRDRLQVDEGEGERPATLTGRLLHEALAAKERPTIGDFVLLSADGERVTATLPRRNLLARAAPGERAETQPIAANLDTLLLVSAMNHEFNPRRLTRYLTLATPAGIAVVVVLTKRDLCPDPTPFIAASRALPGVSEVVAVDALQEALAPRLAPWLEPGETLALAGSSGVGKSTLLNNLLGAGGERTGATSHDDKGRHTTTHRSLHRLPGGACVVDVPGLREVGLPPVAGAVAQQFAEVAELASSCRFRDCSHREEPDCAVQAALASGRLAPERWAAYCKLEEEEAQRVARGQALHERRAHEKHFNKQIRMTLAEKARRRGER